MAVPPDRNTLVTMVKDVAQLRNSPPRPRWWYSTQTTLCVDETQEIVDALRVRFPTLVEPRKSDICYATQNRQDAAKALVAEGIDHLLAVGSVQQQQPPAVRGRPEPSAGHP